MKILITGGAGFIGSSLIDHLLSLGHEVVCLDDLTTGYEKNIEHNYSNPKFSFIKGDIRDFKTCQKAIADCQLVSHQAALGSVPRSIKDPANTNSVNIDGFLNVLIAARDANVKRFVYAASSSTYGDSKKLPKVEEEIGNPLSPYAITKYVNELYADVFSKTYGMQCIGLRYFNVFGKRQDPNGSYAAVIPLWVKKLINLESPVINGDGSYSRDFTYIENVIQANVKALFTHEKSIVNGQIEYYNLEFDKHKYLLQKVKKNLSHDSYIPSGQKSKIYFSEVFNIAYGGNTTLNQLYDALRDNIAVYDRKVVVIKPTYSTLRVGDVPHSQASIIKAKKILDYKPEFDVEKGLKLVVEWYYNEEKKHYFHNKLT